MSLLLFKPVGVEGEIQVYSADMSRIGSLVVESDGYYRFWLLMEGTIPGFVCSELADKLEELNADWDAEVHGYFEKGVVDDEMS